MIGGTAAGGPRCGEILCSLSGVARRRRYLRMFSTANSENDITNRTASALKRHAPLQFYGITLSSLRPSSSAQTVPSTCSAATVATFLSY